MREGRAVLASGVREHVPPSPLELLGEGGGGGGGGAVMALVVPWLDAEQLEDEEEEVDDVEVELDRAHDVLVVRALLEHHVRVVHDEEREEHDAAERVHL